MNLEKENMFKKDIEIVEYDQEKQQLEFKHKSEKRLATGQTAKDIYDWFWETTYGSYYEFKYYRAIREKHNKEQAEKEHKHNEAVIFVKKQITQLFIKVLEQFGTMFWPDLIEYLEDQDFNKETILNFIEDNKDELIEVNRYKDIKKEIEIIFNEEELNNFKWKEMIKVNEEKKEMVNLNEQRKK